MSNFRTIDRQTGFLLPPSVDEWLPEKHLARFVVEVIEGLDLRAMSGSYRGSGSASYHPRMLLGILVYGYATGVFSSRKLERATYDSVAFRFIAANDHPDEPSPRPADALPDRAHFVGKSDGEAWESRDKRIRDRNNVSVALLMDAVNTFLRVCEIHPDRAPILLKH